MNLLNLMQGQEFQFGQWKWKQITILEIWNGFDFPNFLQLQSYYTPVQDTGWKEGHPM